MWLNEKIATILELSPTPAHCLGITDKGRTRGSRLTILGTRDEYGAWLVFWEDRKRR
jgi:hypothetical protein